MLAPAAYGFRIHGGPDGGWLAALGAENWPLLTLERDAEVPAAMLARVDVSARRAAISAELTDDQVVHPVLGRMLYMLAESRGVQAMHGGVLVGPDGAWGVIGPKEGGKSTLLARCAQSGAEVLSDDVIVLDGMRVLAGPRCVDLRDASARTMAAGVPVRRSSRRRLMLPPVPAEVHLAGFVHLVWASETTCVPLPPAERLARLAACRARDRWPRDAGVILDLAARPAFELRRRRVLESLEPSTALLLRELGIDPDREAIARRAQPS